MLASGMKAAAQPLTVLAMVPAALPNQGRLLETFAAIGNTAMFPSELSQDLGWIVLLEQK